MARKDILPERRFRLWWLLGGTALVVIAVTLFGIVQSRRDSYGLLVQQGAAFTEALALACQNTVTSEAYYDRLLADHYADLADLLTAGDPKGLTTDALTAFVRDRGLYGAFVYDTSGRLQLSDNSLGPVVRPPAEVESAVHSLVRDFAARSTRVYREDTLSGLKINYFIEIANQLDRVIVLAADAGLPEEARDRTGIGVLAQKMASEPGIEYILYQAKEGIIVSSGENGAFMSIESDSFLAGALDAESIVARRTTFQDKEILELVRPFSTRKYPFGLLRVGVSLDKYLLVSSRFDRLMVTVAVALLALAAVAFLYFSGRRERETLRRDISDMRSITDRVFAEISTGVMVIGPDGIVRVANSAVGKMLGVATEGKPVGELAPSLPREFLDLTDRESDVEEREVGIKSKNGEKTLLVGRSLLLLADDVKPGIVLVITDITQLKEYEAAAARKERLSEMGHLAAAVAHEIRNPLNAISIAAQRLENELAPRDRREEFVAFTSQIRTETKRLNEIITKFLSLSRANKEPSAKTDVAACLAEFESLVGPEAERLGIVLRVRTETPIYAAIDAARLKEVLLNLYNNAKEAIENAGAEHKEVSVRANRQEGMVRIVVADSGPGIPEAHRSRVLAPYYTTKETGTGIGLAAVHQIVESTGGRLSIGTSELGGAAITVDLPQS